MWFFLVISVVICIILGFSCIRYRTEIHSLNGQLDEIARGSHMELAAKSRRKPFLTLCRTLNRILEDKDKDHIQCVRTERLLKQNITSLAHDIRTPLTGAMGYMQLAQECDEADKRTHYLQVAGMRLTELENMLEEMFLYTKLTSEEFHLSIGKVQILPLLGDCLLGLYAKFEEKRVEPEVSFASEGFCVYGDEEALRRVFVNLIQNALIHGTGGVSITQKGNTLVFENPVPPDSNLNPEQMFDIFYKSDPSRRKGSSGLGLFIVKELMKRMEGDVSAELNNFCLRITLHFSEV